MAYTGSIMMGLKKVESGDLASDGGRATIWQSLGYTNQDSCSLDQDDPTTTEIYAEEVDDPIYQSKKAGNRTITFEVHNPEFSTLVKLCGGKINSEGEYEAEGSLPDIEQSLRLELTTGQVIIYPRVSIAAKFAGTIGKSENLKLTVNGTILQPLKEGEPAMVIVPKA